ncbi:N-formylglutamate amidohydrolase [Acidobacteriota bacterium]
MRLPILLSVPHAGREIPPDVTDICMLSQEGLLEDGDVGADEIYFPLKDNVEAFATTDIGRAIVDLNRAEDDIRKDGVIKTHTCWDVRIYRIQPSPDLIQTLLEKYYYSFHRQLSTLSNGVKLGIDAHTMAALAPPIGTDSGDERPPVCISNAGFTCPISWLESLAECLENSLDFPVSINTPFQGGHIIRSHAVEIPWLQIEYSRAPFLSNKEKSEALLNALKEWITTCI